MLSDSTGELLDISLEYINAIGFLFDLFVGSVKLIHQVSEVRFLSSVAFREGIEVDVGPLA